MVQITRLILLCTIITCFSAFSIPSIPSVPSISSVKNYFPNISSWIPSMPKLPSLPSLPEIYNTSSNRAKAYIAKIPSVSEIFNISSHRARAYIPSIPSMPDIPKIPEISLPSLPSAAQIPSISNMGFNVDMVVSKYNAFLHKPEIPGVILEDAKALVPEVVRNRGYPCEIHKVITPDGYILALHRIPYGRNGPTRKRQAVYLQHGILAATSDWTIASPEKALGYILADAGYDVWMANARGNRYSRNHVTLDPDSAEFWDFSWHEIAIYDVPTMIDYVLETTRQEKLYYIGHSQGTTVFYVMCSEKPEYNYKIKAMFSLAPVAYMSHITSPLFQVLARGAPAIGGLLRIVGMHEFLPHKKFITQMGGILCSEESTTQILCINSVFAICGFNSKQMNTTLLPIVMGHTPAGSSTKQFLHFAQEIRSGKFRQFDYGSSKNQLRYNEDEPPRYHLDKVIAPVYLYYSRNDWLSGETDVERLYNELGNVTAKFLVADKKFNHLDYLFGIDAAELVYHPILKLMPLHSN